VFENVRLALKTMGFRDAPVRDAVAKVQRMHDEPLTVEQALREALRVVTSS
jgi:Holliday junction resolvasome RuvABC DNA-binding subunit